MLLIDIGEFHRLAHRERAGIGLFQAHNESEQGGLTGTVRANNSHDAVGRQHEVEVGEQRLLGI